MYTAFDSHLSTVLGIRPFATQFRVRGWMDADMALAGRRVR
jgi:hypothetical protein